MSDHGLRGSRRYIAAVLLLLCSRSTESETDRQKDRQTDRQTDRYEANRQTRVTYEYVVQHSIAIKGRCAVRATRCD